MEGITSLNSFPVSLLVRITLTAKISKLQNTSQHCDYLDLPRSLFPGIVVDRALSLKRPRLFPYS